MSSMDMLCDKFNNLGSRVIYPLPIYFQHTFNNKGQFQFSLDEEINTKYMSITRLFVPNSVNLTVDDDGNKFYTLTLNSIYEHEFWNNMLNPDDVLYSYFVELSTDDELDETNALLCIIFLKNKNISTLRDNNFEYTWMDICEKKHIDNPYRDIINRRGHIKNNHLSVYQFKVGLYEFFLSDLYDMIANNWDDINKYLMIK